MFLVSSVLRLPAVLPCRFVVERIDADQYAALVLQMLLDEIATGPAFPASDFQDAVEVLGNELLEDRERLRSPVVLELGAGDRLRRVVADFGQGHVFLGLTFTLTLRGF